MAGLNLTGTASLAEELDKKILVLLRDGKKVIGTLRSFDQFANIVLEEAVERIVVGKQYADVPLGLYVIRGENTVLIGAIDDAKEAHTTTEILTEVAVEEILSLKKAEDERKKQLETERQQKKKFDEFGDDV